MLESKYKVDLNPLIHINILHVNSSPGRRDGAHIQYGGTSPANLLL